jgi:hypothetical protein
MAQAVAMKLVPEANKKTDLRRGIRKVGVLKIIRL